MVDNYTDAEWLEITRQQYYNFKHGDPITIRDDTDIVGYVSEVINKYSGENTYIVTDIQLPDNPMPEDLAKVKNVIVLYQGSTADESKLEETIVDWVDNDLLMAIRILVPDWVPTRPTAQLRDASNTLQSVFKTYPNANVYVSGHSLGSMDAQSAVSNVGPEDAHRITGVYIYNGPNIYKTLDDTQRENIARLHYKIFNYVDVNDFIGLGYDTPNVVGQVYRINTEDIGFVEQHMWGGYKTDKFGNFIHADGTLVSSDIRLKHIDIDNDGTIDFKLDSVDVRTRNLLTNDLSLTSSNQPIQVSPELLNTLATNLNIQVETTLSEMQKIINLCIHKNKSVTESFTERKEKITESIQDVFKRAGLSYLLEDMHNSIGIIMKNQNLLEAGTQYAELDANRFSSHQTPMVYGDILNFLFYNTRLATFRYACEPLVTQVRQERTGTLFSIFGGGSPTVMKSWQVVETASQNLLKTSDTLFEGEGLREGKKDGISEAISLVLEVILKNTQEISLSLKNVVSLISSLATNFEMADSWLGRQLEEGKFTNVFSSGPMPSNYKAYLERDAILDDVRDVLHAFDRQVEKNSELYAKKVATVFQETLGSLETSLKEWLLLGDPFKDSITAIVETYDATVSVKEQQFTQVYEGEKIVQKETDVHKEWGKLEELYPSHVKSTISQLQTTIVPTFVKIQQTLWRSQTTKNHLSQLEPVLKEITEDGVYHAFDLDEIVKGQKMVATFAGRLGAEINYVIQTIEGQGMQAQAISTLKQKLGDILQVINFYTQFVNHCFGDNPDVNPYLGIGAMQQGTFSLN